ncbi:hypothetical protein C5Z25_03800 [Lactobacillus sp. CBA3605]|uniref:hypothetical protein n=1 Tax=Lactobacillus sp. CBA3605 TaxID=2099788 RepID=UPI000CFDAB90|nr:hypothetical protein [Lactobacillus sp. CBA3605]AVK60932.1 hypothetical protein C5Z25_03800 [Lactobacillus sp. CBA3605]
MAKEKYDEKDKQVGRVILVAAKWIAIIGGLLGPFVMMMNHSVGLDLGSLSVICGGAAICFGKTGRTPGGQWLALLYTLGLGVLVLLYFVLVAKFI